MSGSPRYAPVDPRDGIRRAAISRLTPVSVHVEGQVAALLRKDGAPQDATLYLNNVVCRGENGGIGCHEILPAILPRGTRLTVFTVRGGREIDRQTYIGTGEELWPTS